jgi:poly(A) polymerase
MRIDPAKHAWMTAPETLSIFAALGAARFVGGAVRNALLGAAVIDIDIAVPLRPLEALNRLEEAGIKVVPTGLDHGTVTAIRNDKVFEITSLRQDVETDGRHAAVVYTADWREDSARRDFTMNALYAGLDGEIFDYHGGVEDLIAGRVRFVGDPAARIREDHLRILRLFRFHAWYGKGDMDGEALRAAANAKSDIAKLSGERIAKELLRLLECSNPVPVLRVMAAAAILPDVLPGALQLARLEHLAFIDAENDFPPDSILRLAALLPDEEDTARTVGERLKLSNADRARLLDGASAGERSGYPSPLEVRKLLYRIGVPRFRDWVLLRWAAGAKGAGAIPWRMLLSVADSWRRPKFSVTGLDVMTAGVPEGPAVGRVLHELEQWWMDNDFPENAPALNEKLKAIVQAGRF